MAYSAAHGVRDYELQLRPRFEQLGPVTLMDPSAAGISNSELCDRIRSGERAAESVLVERLLPGLRLVLRRSVGADIELANELSQETLVIVLMRLRNAGLNNSAELAAFAAQTARNLAIAHYRKVDRRRTDADLEAIEVVRDPGRSQPEQLAARRLGAIVHRLLDELPTERDRAVLKRYYLYEEDKAEICRDLQLSDLAFNQVLFRARNRFRSLLTSAGVTKDDVSDSESAP